MSPRPGRPPLASATPLRVAALLRGDRDGAEDRRGERERAELEGEDREDREEARAVVEREEDRGRAEADRADDVAHHRAERAALLCALCVGREDRVELARAQLETEGIG
jgi:hypothetical protein